jgi:hypothetical protein
MSAAESARAEALAKAVDQRLEGSDLADRFRTSRTLFLSHASQAAHNRIISLVHFARMVLMLEEAKLCTSRQEAADVLRIYLESCAEGEGSAVFNLWCKARRALSTLEFIQYWQDDHCESMESHFTVTHILCMCELHEHVLRILCPSVAHVGATQQYEHLDAEDKQRVVALWRKVWRPRVGEMKKAFVKEGRRRIDTAPLRRCIALAPLCSSLSDALSCACLCVSAGSCTSAQ